MLLLGLLIAAVIYLALLGLLWLNQERIVFQPPPASSVLAVRYAGSEDVRQVSYRADDNIDLFGFVVGDPARAAHLLIAFHGNGDLARFLLPWAQSATRVASVAVLLPEFRGYAGLSGRPTYSGGAADARAARRFVDDHLRIANDRIAYFGHSLGSAIATELASEYTPFALLLQSPFSSARAMARRMALPGLSLFWPIVSRVHYDTEARVRVLPSRVSVAHGLRDMLVPAKMGRAVFDAAQSKGQLLLVPGAGHSDVAERAPADYWRWFAAALDQRS